MEWELIGSYEDRRAAARSIGVTPAPTYTTAEIDELVEQWAIEQQILATDRWNVSRFLAWLAKQERDDQ